MLKWQHNQSLPIIKISQWVIDHQKNKIKVSICREWKGSRDCLLCEWKRKIVVEIYIKST